MAGRAALGSGGPGGAGAEPWATRPEKGPPGSPVSAGVKVFPLVSLGRRPAPTGESGNLLCLWAGHDWLRVFLRRWPLSLPRAAKRRKTIFLSLKKYNRKPWFLRNTEILFFYSWGVELVGPGRNSRKRGVRYYNFCTDSRGRLTTMGDMLEMW